MAAFTNSTSLQFSGAHRRKKNTNKPKQESDSNRKTDMNFKRKWKVADVDYSVLKLDELREFMGIEELSLKHEVIMANMAKPTSALSKNRHRLRHRVHNASSHLEQTTMKRKEPPTEDQETSPKNKKKKMQQRGLTSTRSALNPSSTKKETQQDAEEDAMAEDEDKEIALDTKRRKGKSGKKNNRNQKSKKKASSFTKGIPVPTNVCDVNMSAWKNLHVPAPVLKALQDLGFKEPTPIQKASIPAAIQDGKDIVGAAETGSGKTLAFGIPVIHTILQHKAALQREARSKAYKQMTIETTTNLVTTTEKCFASLEKRMKGKASERMGTDQKREMEIKDDDGDKYDDDDEGEEGEDVDDGDDEVDEDIEYDLDEDEEDDLDYDEDDYDDDKEETQDVDTPTVKPPKRPKGKKGQRKRRFRIQERKMQELDGEEFEGIELINKMEKRGFGCVRAIDNVSDVDMLAQTASGKMVQQIEEVSGGSHDDRQLYAMILMPTRELAVQVKNHLVAVAKYTDIKIAVIVGGMSAQKQERVLKKRPEIVVGTPGRIWELFREGEPHLSTMSGVRCLVLDEADRMVEKGHYEQLTEILRQMNHSPASLQRQTFVFSATLTLVHLGPDRKVLANKASKNKNPKQEKKDRKEKINSLMKKVGIRDNPAVVDLTQKRGTVASLMEAKIICDITDKDVYLYYFLLQFPGRTLVFCNSIDCIRRLCSILTLLACNPLPLHSSMHQKQRLKNMDSMNRALGVSTLSHIEHQMPDEVMKTSLQKLRFASNAKALLLATDVAARGLDIPDIEHVIHYQVPRTSETYIHRSGRTARQAKEGISVMLVSPTEANFYRRVCKTLNRDDIPSFPVDHMYYNAVKERVDLARLIDQTNHRVEKKKHANDWFMKAAKELDVDLDEDLVLHDLGDSGEQMQHERKMQHMKCDLKHLLKRTISPRGSSWLFPTAAGKLFSPLEQGSTSAFSMLKNKVDNRTKDAPQVTEPPKKAKKSKNKFKRTEDEKAI